MSESVPERTTGGGNFWTQKAAGLPVFVWGLLVVGVIAGYMYIKNKNSAASATDTTSTDQTAASQVPQFVNQTYTTVNPPAENTTTFPLQGGNPPHITGTPPTESPTPVTPPAKTPPKKSTGTLSAPSDIKATKVTASSITVSWGKVTGATGYSGRVTYQDKLVSSKTSTGTSMTFTGLGADHTYTVHIATKNGAGTGAESNGPAVKTSR